MLSADRSALISAFYCRPVAERSVIADGRNVIPALTGNQVNLQQLQCE